MIEPSVPIWKMSPRGRLVLAGLALRAQQQLAAVRHRLVERADRLRAPDEERHHHVREDDDVAQRQQRQRSCAPLRVRPRDSSPSFRKMPIVLLRAPTADSASCLSTSSGFAPCSITSSLITHSSTSSRDGMSYIRSSITFSRIERRPRAPDLRASAWRATARSAPSEKRSRTSSNSKSFWYCLTSAFFGSVRMSTSAFSSSSVSVAITGRRPTNSGISPNCSRSSACTCVQDLALRAILARLDLGAEAHAAHADAALDDRLEVAEGAAADEQDVRRVDLQELLLRVLAAALGRHARHRALDDLEQRLLHALARDVARDRRVLALARDLVDLVDVDDAALRALDVVVRDLEQVQDDVLDVLADVARLGERGGVGDRERHVEDARQRLREQRLAGAGRPEQQDVRLLQLDVADEGLALDAPVVVVHRHREDLLRALLADHVLVERCADLARLRDARAGATAALRGRTPRR